MTVSKSAYEPSGVEVARVLLLPMTRLLLLLLLLLLAAAAADAAASEIEVFPGILLPPECSSRRIIEISFEKR